MARSPGFAGRSLGRLLGRKDSEIEETLVNTTMNRLCRPAVATAKRALPPRRPPFASSRNALLAATPTRWYRGDSGPEERHANTDPATLAREEALWAKARPRYDAILERHTSLDHDDDVRRKRLVYRSKQRGWLEVDLLLGTWAARHVPGLSAGELDEFERFVNLETVDIYNVLTLRADVPEELKSEKEGELSLAERIQQWAKESPLGKADREKYDEVKTAHNLI